MRRVLIGGLLVLSLGTPARADDGTCADRLRAVGLNPTRLPDGKTFTLDGQPVTIRPGDIGQALCDRVDAANEPLRKAAERIADLEGQVAEVTAARDEYKRLAEQKDNWLKAQYALGWSGWGLVSLWVVFQFLRHLKPRRKSAYRSTRSLG